MKTTVRTRPHPASRLARASVATLALCGLVTGCASATGYLVIDEPDGAPDAIAEAPRIWVTWDARELRVEGMPRDEARQTMPMEDARGLDDAIEALGGAYVAALNEHLPMPVAVGPSHAETGGIHVRVRAVSLRLGSRGRDGQPSRLVSRLDWSVGTRRVASIEITREVPARAGTRAERRRLLAQRSAEEAAAYVNDARTRARAARTR